MCAVLTRHMVRVQNYLEACQSICHENDILFIADEVSLSFPENPSPPPPQKTNKKKRRNCCVHQTEMRAHAFGEAEKKFQQAHFFSLLFCAGGVRFWTSRRALWVAALPHCMAHCHRHVALSGTDMGNVRCPVLTWGLPLRGSGHDHHGQGAYQQAFSAICLRAQYLMSRSGTD
eukprot:1477142-Rhodomonas_salina.5